MHVATEAVPLHHRFDSPLCVTSVKRFKDISFLSQACLALLDYELVQPVGDQSRKDPHVTKRVRRPNTEVSPLLRHPPALGEERFYIFNVFQHVVTDAHIYRFILYRPAVAFYEAELINK